MATSVEMQPHEVTAPSEILHDKMRVGCPELKDVRRTGSGVQQQRRLLANISEHEGGAILPAALLESSDDENFDDPFENEEELLRRRDQDRDMRQNPPLPANESFLKYGLDQDSIWNAAAAAGIGTTTSSPRTPRASSSSIWASRVLPPPPASPPSSPVSEPPSPQPRSFSSVATKAGAANINQQQSAKVKQKIAKAQQKAIRSKGAAVTPGFAASPRSRSVTMRKQPQDQPPPPRTRQPDQSDWSPKHKRDPVAPGLQCCETDAEIMRTLPTEMRKEIRDLASKAAACSTNFMEFPVCDAREAVILTAHYVLLRREKGGSKLASVMGCLGQNKSYKKHMGATQNERLRRLQFATTRIHRSPPVTRKMFELGGTDDADQASRVKISVAPGLA